MATLNIDGQTVEVADGATVLDACRRLGIEIPTLCFREDRAPQTTCMLCVVEDKPSGKLLPSCSAVVRDGMCIETGGEKVVSARRTAIELLLSDHVGDCEAPCRVACPAGMDIPKMIRQIASGAIADALRTVKRDIALPAVLGRICPAPCERVCRRRPADDAVSVCLLKRYVADVDLDRESPWLPVCLPPSGRKVAIVGTGPAGLAAAYHLLQRGHACTLYDDQEMPGGMLRRGVSEDVLPRSVLGAEISLIVAMGAEFRLATRLGQDVSLAELRGDYDAVVLAFGKPDPDVAARMELELTDKGRLVAAAGTLVVARGLFAGGAAVRQCRMAVLALAHGKAIAASVSQYLSGFEVIGRKRRFNSRMGALKEGELERFVENASSTARVVAAGDGLAEQEAVAECARCLHCDCRKPESCRLRIHAETLGASQGHFAGTERKAFRQLGRQGDVVYEPEKCIKCGLCVEITRREKEAIGLSFVGRGFDVTVAAPFGAGIDAALARTAAACIAACPTGALARREGEDDGDTP